MTAARDYAAAAEVLEGLGQAVRERRLALHLQRFEVAEQAHTSPTCVDDVEAGYPIKTHATVALLRWLARTSEEA